MSSPPTPGPQPPPPQSALAAFGASEPLTGEVSHAVAFHRSVHGCEKTLMAWTDEEAEADAELSAYLTGAQTVPVPTYFIGSFGAGSRRAMAALAASSSADITYLGRRRVTVLLS